MAATKKKPATKKEMLRSSQYRKFEKAFYAGQKSERLGRFQQGKALSVLTDWSGWSDTRMRKTVRDLNGGSLGGTVDDWFLKRDLYKKFSNEKIWESLSWKTLTKLDDVAPKNIKRVSERIIEQREENLVAGGTASVKASSVRNYLKEIKDPAAARFGGGSRAQTRLSNQQLETSLHEVGTTLDAKQIRKIKKSVSEGAREVLDVIWGATV